MAIDYQYHRQSSHRIQILNSFFCLHLFILFGKFPKLPPQASDLSFSKCPQKGQILHKYLNPKLQLPLSSCDCKGKYFSRNTETMRLRILLLFAISSHGFLTRKAS